MLFSRLQELRRTFDNDVLIFEAPAVIIENGYEAIPVNFILYPRDKEITQDHFHTKKRGSCFELLRKLVKKPQSSMPLSKESLIAILSRNSQLVDDLKATNYNMQVRNEEDFEFNFNIDECELLVSVENGRLLRIPTFDFAIVKQDDALCICTALEDFDERIFFQVTNFSSSLEEMLKRFMIHPQSNNHSRNINHSFPLLPSVDVNNIVINPPNFFENFIDESAEDYENNSINENYNNNLSQDFNMEISEKSIKSSSSSHVKPKRSESASKTPSGGFRQCLNCFCTSTPMWRRGPDGTASLCNACGVKFKAGKLQMGPELVEENMRKINQNRLINQQQSQE